MPLRNFTLKRLVLLAVSVWVTLGFCELLARVFFHIPNSINVQQKTFNDLGPIPIPHQHGTIDLPEAHFDYSNNSIGLRGEVEYGPKTKPRVLLLGDSFTYGLGVNDDQTFARPLQHALPSYEVINAGNPNTGTDYALKFYQARGRTLQPDIVILSFFENDFRDNQRHWYFDDDARPVPLPYNVTHPNERSFPLRSWLVDHSRLVYLAKLVVNNYIYDRGLQPQLTERYLKELKDETQRDGARFVVLSIPMREHLSDSLEQTTLAEITQRLSVPLIQPPLQPSDYLKEGHWNPHGHEIAAKAIQEVVIGGSSVTSRPPSN